MTHWKARLSRLTLSTVSLAVFTGIGGFSGAIVGGLFELMMLALFETTLPALEVIAGFMALGIATAFLWGLWVVVQSYRPAPTPAPRSGDTQPVPVIQ